MFRLFILNAIVDSTGFLNLPPYWFLPTACVVSIFHFYLLLWDWPFFILDFIYLLFSFTSFKKYLQSLPGVYSMHLWLFTIYPHMISYHSIVSYKNLPALYFNFHNPILCAPFVTYFISIYVPKPCFYFSWVCAQSLSCVRLYDPMNCRLWGSFVHGIFQARILEWVAISSSRGSSWPWVDRNHVSYVPYTGRWILSHCVTWEAPYFVYK